MKKLNTQAQAKEIETKLNFILDEAIPADQEGRRKYVGDISFFWGSIFRKKIEHFIGEQLVELSKIGRSEEVNNIIRANINCFHLINSWMEKMDSEHQGNLNAIRESFPVEKDFISELKKTYGEN